MDLNHVQASLCFPTFPRFCGQVFAERADKELALACVRAYNDWMVEEWAGDSGGRLVPLCIVPLWDAQLAADEVRRNAARGVHAVAFSELPGKLGLPTIHSGAVGAVLRRVRRRPAPRSSCTSARARTGSRRRPTRRRRSPARSCSSRR